MRLRKGSLTKGGGKVNKLELLKHQLVKNGLSIVKCISMRGQVILGEENEGLIVLESSPEDILSIKKYLSFYGYKYLVRIRKTKMQILVKL